MRSNTLVILAVQRAGPEELERHLQIEISVSGH